MQDKGVLKPASPMRGRQEWTAPPQPSPLLLLPQQRKKLCWNAYTVHAQQTGWDDCSHHAVEVAMQQECQQKPGSGLSGPALTQGSRGKAAALQHVVHVTFAHKTGTIRAQEGVAARG